MEIVSADDKLQYPLHVRTTSGQVLLSKALCLFILV